MLQKNNLGANSKDLAEFPSFSSYWQLTQSCPAVFSVPQPAVIRSFYNSFLVERPYIQARLQVSWGMKFRIPPCRAQGICPFLPAASPPSLHQEPGGSSPRSPAPCTHKSITEELSWPSPTSRILRRKGPWGFHVHCTSVTMLFVYMSVNSGSMLRVLVTLNSGALPRYSCVSWWNKYTSLLLGVFPSSLCGFSFIT